jgi:hypothetical protein
MPIKVERLLGESIILAVITLPFNPEHDIPTMFGQFISLRMTIQDRVALILDFTSTIANPEAFGIMVQALAQASRGIRASREAGVGGPPITIFVGSGPIAAIASEALEQEQYGGVRGQLCVSRDDALTLARSLLVS